MSVNRHPTKPGHWQIRYYPEGRKGKQKVVVVSGSYEEALQWEAELRAKCRYRSGIDLFPRINEIIPFYLEYYKLDHLAPGNVARYLDLWKPFIGNLQFTSISADVIERYKHYRLKLGISPASINKELSALSGLCKWAEERGYCGEIKIKRFPRKMTRAPLPDVPTREEVLALINCMIWPRCGLFFCLYYGGLRKSEACGLQAEDIHLDRGVMIVTGKGNRQRVVPIVDELRPILKKRLNEKKTGLLWTTRNGKPISDLKKIIKLAKERAGLKRHFYPHLLRHAFGTHATMFGVGMRQLQKAMGHSNVTTTEIYTTLSNEAVINDIVGKFGKKL